MYSVTEALALVISGAISGAKSISDALAEVDIDDDGGREIGEGTDKEDDGEDAGSCGYKDAGSSIASFWISSSREMHGFDVAFIMASSTDSDDSSNGSTV